MRQTSRGKQWRPTFDALDHRIAPSGGLTPPTEPPPTETPDTTGEDTTTRDTTTTIIYQPPGTGGSTPRPR